MTHRRPSGRSAEADAPGTVPARFGGRRPQSLLVGLLAVLALLVVSLGTVEPALARSRRTRSTTTTTTSTSTTSTTSTTTPPAPTTTTTTAPPPTTTTTAPPPATTTTTTIPPAPAPLPAGARDPFLWPFSSTSPWNMPIGFGAVYAPATSSQTANLRLASVTPWVNARSYSHPVVRARESDPQVSVLWRYAAFAPWTNGTSTYRIPLDASPALGSDAHLHVVAPDGVTLHETYQHLGTGTSRTAFKYATFDLRGSGIGSVPGTNAGTRAYGGSAIGGLIRRGELEGGTIPHALALTLTNGQLKSGYVWPATSQDTGGSTYAGEVPMGSLVAIPANVDLGSLGLSPAGLVVARALQDYGAYVVDRGGSFALYAEPAAEDLVGPVRADLAAIRAQLSVVQNNGPSTVGGGGTPRRPLAPAL